MGKLITPVEYERRLDALNQVRPLHRVDTVQTVISLPVLSVSGVDDSGLLDGKVLRCVDGSVLSSQPKKFTDFEARTHSTIEGSPLNIPITWLQRVRFLQIIWSGDGAPGAVRIRNPGNTYNIWFTGTWGVFYFPFDGWEILFRINDAGQGYNTVEILGFY